MSCERCGRPDGEASSTESRGDEDGDELYDLRPAVIYVAGTDIPEEEPLEV